LQLRRNVSATDSLGLVDQDGAAANPTERGGENGNYLHGEVEDLPVEDCNLAGPSAPVEAGRQYGRGGTA
jgi:hypothetical protein